MNGGWKRFGFKNQGQCISFVNEHRRHHEHDGTESHRDDSWHARLVSALTPSGGSGAAMFGTPFLAMLVLGGALGTRNVRRRRA
jgi:hypothetical protein